MPRPPLLSVLAACALFLGARSASAGLPGAESSTWPHHVVLVGTDGGGTPDPIGKMDFQINHLLQPNNPYGSPLIVLDFSACPGVEICANQGDPAMLADCPTHTVRTIGDNFGRATMIVTGRIDRNFANSHAPTAKLYVDGVLFGTIPVSAYDQDGFGLGAADNSLWQTDYFSGQYWERTDFDGDGSLGAADLSAWLRAYFGSGSTRGCSTGNVCP